MKAVLTSLAMDAQRTATTRLLAAEVMLGLRGGAERTAIEAVLRSGHIEYTSVIRQVLVRLRKDPETTRRHLEALLDLFERVESQTWYGQEVLRTLATVAGDDPRVRERVRRAVNRKNVKNVTIRGVARDIIFRGPVEDVLAFLATASASARIAGASRLLRRGVAKELLIEHVLAGLRNGGFGTRTRAIQLLGKVGRNLTEVLPIVEEHFSSDDKGRWLSGVQALGALATVPGDKQAVVRRLLEVGRRPDVRVRTAAVQAILMHDAQPAPVIELLTYLLDDADAGVRAEAVDALGELSARHATAKSALERARTDPSPQVRELVIYWLDEDEED